VRGSRLIIALVALPLLAAASCHAPGGGVGGGGEPPVQHGSGTLRVLAGSSLVDLEPVLDEVRQATGVTVQLGYTGTLDGMKAVANGSAAKGYDATWFDTSRYFDLLMKGSKAVEASTPVMTSPVIVGVRQSVAARLGWDNRRPTWGEIADALGGGKLGFAMTNPAASNSGFCGLVGMATALSGGGTSPLTLDQVHAVAPRLRALFTAQQLTAGSSGWLADEYVKRARDGRVIDAIVNYESVLLSLNAGGQLPEKLTLVYPADGVVTAEYPFSLLAGASDQARTNYRAVASYLTRASVQREIMQKTHRRPVSSSVPLGFATPSLIELPFPDSASVVDALIGAYANTLRRPARTIYVLDVSGSMRGDRIAGLQNAMLGLTGANPSPDLQYLGFEQREQVVLLTFSSTVNAPQRFEVPPDTPGPTLAKIGAAVRGLKAGGDTDLYDALERAYQLAGEPATGDPYTTIVLLTDGEVTTGPSYTEFQSAYQSLPDSLRRIPVFPLLFGENNVGEMTSLAQLTGGKVFDARTGTLAAAFTEIRGYQ
jgi:Ca-activated chloride channel family protein